MKHYIVFSLTNGGFLSLHKSLGAVSRKYNIPASTIRGKFARNNRYIGAEILVLEVERED